MKVTQTLRWTLVGLLFLGAGQAQTRKPPAQGTPPRPLSQQQPANHWSVNPAAPGADGYEVHTVKQGDTLWELGKQYLNDPFLWPQIWEMNNHVKNPHWIYPGDQILIKKLVVMNQPPAEKHPIRPSSLNRRFRLRLRQWHPRRPSSRLLRRRHLWLHHRLRQWQHTVTCTAQVSLVPNPFNKKQSW